MSKTRSEEEEYWNSSKFKAFTFDDEDDEFTQLRESKRAVNSIRDFVDEDEDDIEKVSWSGDVVGSISWSVKETAANTRTAGQVRDHGFPRSPTEPASDLSSITKHGTAYTLSNLFKGRSKPASLYSLSDAILDTPNKSFAPELRRPKAEYKDFSSDWSPEDTVRRMQKGKPYSLERFRSLKDKLLLLDEAVRLHDGNSITAVLIFLQKSLSKEVLLRELETRQVALEHFIHLLKENQDHKLLQELLRVLGRTEEVALLQYREYLNIKDENKRKEFLKSCIGLPFLPEDMAHVQDHYTLLERQIIMEASDKRVEAAGQVEVFKKYPRKASILNMPLITTLYYSCFYHYTESEGTFSSPANLKKTFKLSDKQYLLVALAARAKLREWREVDNLFTTKNWLGYTKKRAPIGFHRIVDILHRNNAPVQVLQEYVCLVDDTDLRLNLALKYKCHSVVIDVYKDLKDRQQLMVYRCKLARGSLEERKIDDILSNTQIRWKN
ncbi:spermatogenesis-defective protein 39 homolog [Latimeria chalumnae]|uniref:spermatogenesis-defective protein 39 homolog n=1 Tax=Latimeria chalumnae TaxID=7897 RepID=UPI0006D8E8DB|nr:PREDICTED: spermatogenesis-defective protein 39 homolog [Latimeria chalumnae]|eukprot:XP_014341992.1 PREDICTED: spermatogenesis-defective protein 39 homolog [Latimeria chalumnae]